MLNELVVRSFHKQLVTRRNDIIAVMSALMVGSTGSSVLESMRKRTHESLYGLLCRLFNKYLSDMNTNTYADAVNRSNLMPAHTWPALEYSLLGFPLATILESNNAADPSGVSRSSRDRSGSIASISSFQSTCTQFNNPSSTSGTNNHIIHSFLYYIRAFLTRSEQLITSSLTPSVVNLICNGSMYGSSTINSNNYGNSSESTSNPQELLRQWSGYLLPSTRCAGILEAELLVNHWYDVLSAKSVKRIGAGNGNGAANRVICFEALDVMTWFSEIINKLKGDSISGTSNSTTVSNETGTIRSAHNSSSNIASLADNNNNDNYAADSTPIPMSTSVLSQQKAILAANEAKSKYLVRAVTTYVQELYNNDSKKNGTNDNGNNNYVESFPTPAEYVTWLLEVNVIRSFSKSPETAFHVAKLYYQCCDPWEVM